MDEENPNVLRGKITSSEVNLENQATSSYSYPEVDKGQIRPKNKKNSAIISAFIGLGLILVIAITALASGMWDPLWNPFQPNPDKVVAQAFQNTNALEMAHINTTIDAIATGDLPEDNGSLNFVFEGNIDESNKDNPKAETAFTINASVQGMNFLIGGEFRSIGQALYFKLDTIPMPATLYLSQVGINTDSWKGKWISLDSKDIGMSIGASSEQKQKLSEDIQRLLLEKPVAKVTKRLVDEKINGQNNYHYLMTVNKENLKQLLVQIPELITKYNILPGGKELSNEEKQKMFESIDNMFDKTGEINFQIWISKKDRLINKIAFNRVFSASDFGEKESGELTLKMELLYSKFNQQVKIETPQNSTSIIELLDPLMQMFMGRPNLDGSDTLLPKSYPSPNYDYLPSGTE